MNPLVEFVNDGGTVFVNSAGSMLIQSSVLITILFGLDLMLRKYMRAVFRYWLWMLVLIKLVLPGSLALPFSLGYWMNSTFDAVEASLPGFDNTPNQPLPGNGDSYLPITEGLEAGPAWLTESNALSATQAGPDASAHMESVADGAAGHLAVPAISVDEAPAQMELTQATLAALSWQGGAVWPVGGRMHGGRISGAVQNALGTETGASGTCAPRGTRRAI